MPATYTDIGSQVYVFMQSYGRRDQSIDDHLDAVFDTIHSAGIHMLEGWLDWFDSPELTQQIQSLLDKKQLRLPAAYTNVILHDPAAVGENIAHIVQLAKTALTVGCQTVNVNPQPIDWNNPVDKTDAQLQTQSGAINRLADELIAAGLSLTIHHHDSEMRNDAKEFYHILHNTDADKVGFCLDFDWIMRGNQSPEKLLRDVGTRLATAHLRNGVNGRWQLALGPGDIDYPALHAILGEIGYTGPLVIELAHESDMLPVDNIGMHLGISREYVQRVFGV